MLRHGFLFPIPANPVKETIMSRSIAFVAIAAYAALTACTTNPLRVRVDQDTSRNVVAYRTFGFYDKPSTDSASYQTLLTKHLQASTRQQLEGRGYVFSQDNPQLLVNFAVNVRPQQEIRATPTSGAGLRATYRGLGGYDIDTVTTKQGTVIIDVVDAASRSIVWQGVGEGAISSKAARNTGAAVNGAVSAIFRDFPSRAAL
jgi:hypothetical protein